MAHLKKEKQNVDSVMRGRRRRGIIEKIERTHNCKAEKTQICFMQGQCVAPRRRWVGGGQCDQKKIAKCP